MDGETRRYKAHNWVKWTNEEKELLTIWLGDHGWPGVSRKYTPKELCDLLPRRTKVGISSMAHIVKKAHGQNGNGAYTARDIPEDGTYGQFGTGKTAILKKEIDPGFIKKPIQSTFDINQLINNYIQESANKLAESMMNKLAGEHLSKAISLNDRVDKLIQENTKLQEENEKMKTWLRKATKLREAVQEFEASI